MQSNKSEFKQSFLSLIGESDKKGNKSEFKGEINSENFSLTRKKLNAVNEKSHPLRGISTQLTGKFQQSEEVSIKVELQPKSKNILIGGAIFTFLIITPISLFSKQYFVSGIFVLMFFINFLIQHLMIKFDVKFYKDLLEEKLKLLTKDK